MKKLLIILFLFLINTSFVYGELINGINLQISAE